MSLAWGRRRAAGRALPRRLIRLRARVRAATIRRPELDTDDSNDALYLTGGAPGHRVPTPRRADARGRGGVAGGGRRGVEENRAARGGGRKKPRALAVIC